MPLALQKLALLVLAHLLPTFLDYASQISPLQFNGVGVLPFLIGFFFVRLCAPSAIRLG